MKPYVFSALLATLVFGLSPCPAQEAGAPPTTAAPLERPRPLEVVERADPGKILESILATLKAADFAVDTSDRKEFVLEGRRFYDKKRPKDYDRVIVWLTRNVATPENVEVYLLHGRYIEVFGGRTRVERIVATTEEQEERFGQLKQDLRASVTAAQEGSR